MANTAHLEHSTHLLEGILLLLVLSVMSVTAFRTLRLTPILGYLLVGMVAPYFLDWMRVTQNPAIDFMGEVGVVFLLSAIGLEFSVNQLIYHAPRGIRLRRFTSPVIYGWRLVITGAFWHELRRDYCVWCISHVLNYHCG